MELEYLSVSRKLLWDLCHQQYKYKYVDKIPSPFEEKKFFLYGKIIHKIGELYVSAKGESPIEQIVKEVVEGRVPIDKSGECAKELPIEYQRKLPEHVRSLKSLTDKIGFDQSITEWELFFDMQKPKGYYVKGYVDRIIQKKDKIFVLDYKTTKKGMWRKNSLSILDDIQLRVYCKYIQEHFKVPAENISAALYYLDGSNLVGATYSQASLDNAEQQMLKTYLEIKEMPPEAVRGTIGDHCRFCDYRKICPWRSLI